MKKFLKFGFLAGIAAMAMSCTDPVKSLTGGYSYQVGKQEVVIDDTVSVVLTSEMGALQMEKSKDDEVLLTFNSMKGDVYTTTGKLDDKTITLAPFNRTLTVTYTITQEELLRPVEKTVSETYNIEVSGEAEIHDETIHFTLQYAGTGVSDDKEIVGEDILMIAKKN